jgi:hypothetical protein
MLVIAERRNRDKDIIQELSTLLEFQSDVTSAGLAASLATRG